MRGYSSVGRALPLQGRCQRFKSAYLHQFHMSPLFFLLFFVRDVVSSCFFETTGNNSKKVGVFLNVKPPSVFGNGLCKMRNFQVDGNRTVEGAFPKTSFLESRRFLHKVKSVHSGIKSFIFSTSFSAWLKILVVRVDYCCFAVVLLFFCCCFEETTRKNWKQLKTAGYGSLRRSNSIMLMVDT
jgi:hypothetical protein